MAVEWQPLPVYPLLLVPVIVCPLQPGNVMTAGTRSLLRKSMHTMPFAYFSSSQIAACSDSMRLLKACCASSSALL